MIKEKKIDFEEESKNIQALSNECFFDNPELENIKKFFKALAKE